MSYIDSLRVFVRVVELGSITAGGRDLRMTPAVASKRIKELEAHLGVRLFNRTTRKLSPTGAGRIFYDEARKVLDSVETAEAAVASHSATPRGEVRIAAPLGVGRRIIAPLVPAFVARFPDIQVQMRLSDRVVDLMAERLDVAFFVGQPQDSTLKLRRIETCRRVLCAAPDYLARHGTPHRPADLLDGRHNCLLLRYPRSPEYFWTLETGEGPRKLAVSGRFDADDSDVLTDWMLAGHGIANRPLFDVAHHIAAGRLVEVLPQTPPSASLFGCLYPHRRWQDPKLRLLVDFMVEHSRKRIRAAQ